MYNLNCRLNLFVAQLVYIEYLNLQLFLLLTISFGTPWTFLSGCIISKYLLQLTIQK